MNDTTVLRAQQAPQDVQIVHGDGNTTTQQIENGTYLQFLSRECSSECVSNEVDNLAMLKVSQKGDGDSSNDEYTTMKSIGSLRNNETSVISTTNKMADANVNENNYTVFIGPWLDI